MPATMRFGGADAPIARADQLLGTSPMVRRPLDVTGRAVLLATDGSPSAVAAARVAHALATQHHALVHVVSVVDTRPAPIPPPLDIALAMGDAIGGSEVERESERAVRAELSGALDEPVAWPIRIMLGTPASAIVQEAHHVGAVLTVVGLRRHSRLDRAVHDETALNVMRTAACPVLGVVAEQSDLPRRILSAIDFSEGSLVGEEVARRLNVREHELGVQTGFEKLARDVGGEGMTFDHVVLHHAPPQSVGQALLEYADEARCDLITAGSVQHSRMDRWMVGSVSTEMVRDGRRSVLIVPPRRYG